MSVADGIARVRAEILRACHAAGRDPGEVRLLPVSKGRSLAEVAEALACGVVELGENRVQELAEKAEAFLGDQVRWHLIGTLQTNKVRQLARIERLVLVHSLDRPALADALQRELAARSRVLDVLLQVRATAEPTKHGVLPEQAGALLAHVTRSCPSLRLRGLMAMGPLEGDPGPAFAAVARLRAELEQAHSHALPLLSLGMSGDLAAAIAHGSTLVRVGTAIFAD